MKLTNYEKLFVETLRKLIVIDPVKDKNGDEILIGHTIRSVTSSFKMEINDYCEFLKFLGAYEKEHGVDLCKSIVVVKDD